jgi:hypothetical protein
LRQTWHGYSEPKNNNSMKTQNTTKLAFAKNAIVELNDDHLNNVNGGSLLLSAIVVAISVAAGYTVGKNLN